MRWRQQARAQPERPLGWVAMEPDRAFGHQNVRVQSWPGGDGGWTTLATSRAHGSWIGSSESAGDRRPSVVLPDAARVIV